jgi:hypothetical protein
MPGIAVESQNPSQFNPIPSQMSVQIQAQLAFPKAQSPKNPTQSYPIIPDPPPKHPSHIMTPLSTHLESNSDSPGRHINTTPPPHIQRTPLHALQHINIRAHRRFRSHSIDPLSETPSRQQASFSSDLLLPY